MSYDQHDPRRRNGYPRMSREFLCVEAATLAETLLSHVRAMARGDDKADRRVAIRGCMANLSAALALIEDGARPEGA